MPGNKVRALEIGVIDTADDLTAGVIAITLTEACFQIRIVNDSDIPVNVMYGYSGQIGADINDLVRADTDLEVITQTNALPPNSVALWPIGTTVAIQSDNPGNGGVYVSAYYQEA